MLNNLYSNFENHTLTLTKPRSFTASKLYIYPDKSRVWGGSDYHAMVHLSKAFNFYMRYELLLSFNEHIKIFSYGNWYRLEKVIDGKFGSIIDKDMNLFNGMIGMLQRKVKMLQNIK